MILYANLHNLTTIEQNQIPLFIVVNSTNHLGRKILLQNSLKFQTISLIGYPYIICQLTSRILDIS